MTRTWIVGFDFSAQAMRAVERAADQLSGLGGGRLIVAHVHQLVGLRFGPDGLPFSPEFDDLEDTLVAGAKKTLADKLAPVIERYPALTFDGRVELGHPADVLSALATSEHAEQIVVGSHGRRGLERFFLGSVAERVLRMSEIPVLVVKGPP